MRFRYISPGLIRVTLGEHSVNLVHDDDMAKLSGREESVKAVRAHLIVTCPNIVDSLLIILDAMSEDNPVMEFSA